MSKKVVKITNYCTILQQSIIDKGSYGYGIEKIIVNDGDGQEEIRFMYEKNTVRGRHLVARPLDLPEQDLIELLDKAIQEKLFSKDFINKLKEILNK
ncbi:hypothetical protein [Romboutsia sp.]|uniref:hypothetical protein n=1 Tax=Romboutsia sp. TaxID=1965302 RepID=UPI003F2BDF12